MAMMMMITHKLFELHMGIKTFRSSCKLILNVFSGISRYVRDYTRYIHRVSRFRHKSVGVMWLL
jgi:hypothetical protein